MSAVPVGGFGSWPTLGQLLIKAAEAGCTIRDLSGQVVTPDGPVMVRYIHIPGTAKYWIVPDIGDDELVAPWTVGNMERRLGIKTGFPSIPHPNDD
jgi:hypothetical protein